MKRGMEGLTPTEKRREMRRMKILMNSEDRMKRLHGHSTTGTSDEGNASGSDSWNGRLSNSEDYDSSNIFSSQSQSVSLGQDQLTDNDREREIDNILLNKTIGSEPPYIDARQNISSEMKNENVSDGIVLHQQSQQKIFDAWRLLIFLIVGILVRLSFLTSFGAEYVQSLFNPFMALEIAVVGYQRAIGMDVGATVKGGLWYSALVLAGVKSEVITSYKILTGTIMAASSDFAVYIFAFIVCHVCV